ncbi:phosphatidylserine decarboxylase 1 [Puccinia graminis f. sp. tritici]|uniref:Phosphatidylserine decarboxylase proenzyme 1, mitochondrial n=1 Tax=Puccinia graminis f. sp. tritici TaxID=56615 RepID=A0A5B0MPQ7_PUCGR|nr:phosphatidylserine decarboxylase 1 [Puccinia graminis f. sp. tritici]
MNYYGTRRLLRLTRTTTATATARIEHHQLIYLIHPLISQKNSSFFSSQTNSENPRSKKDEGEDNYLNRLKVRLKNTKTNWKPIPIWIGASLLGLITYLKKIDDRSGSEGEGSTRKADSTTITPVKIEGPWQVHVLGALPLRTISRLYGLLNSYTLPIWFRVPGYKLYSWIFGVNLEEAEIEDLKQYKSLNDFFMRKLKKECRPIDPHAILTSPSDGKIINFGTIEGRRVGSVKGLSYSVDALLLGPNEQKKLNESEGKKRSSEESQVSNSRFANINDISYSVDELMGGSENTQHDQDPTESSVASQPVSPGAGLASSVKVHTDIVRGELETLPSSGNRMFFFVVYLAPGDYHRFHSPADWKVERRRHFAGELFSVSPWMAGKLADLFVLNERVALLGRWRHGFFSMTPVGATNVGSILINFDRELRTNRVDKRCHEEMVYGTNNAIFDGQVLAKGTEVGAFSLGSTIVLVFEAPEQFQFSVKKGEPVRVGQAIGNI